ncbi:MAG: hypothetical protein ACNA8K_13235 [Cyclonatronaceae bacterium]
MNFEVVPLISIIRQDKQNCPGQAVQGAGHFLLVTILQKYRSVTHLEL